MPLRSTRLVGVAFVIALAGAAAAAEAQPTTVRVTSGDAVIRAMANPRSTVLAKPQEGMVLDVLGRENDWYKVIIPPGLRARTTVPESGYIDVHQVTPVPEGGGEVVPPRGAPAAPGRRGAAPARQPGQPLRVRVFGTVMYERFAAVESFDALYGSPSAPVFGGGVDVSVGRQYFVQADVTHLQRTGERAFVFNGEVFRLGIRQEMRLTPVAVTVGYRRPGRSRVTPYAGAGALMAFYREQADLAVDEDVSKTAVGAQGIAGAEIRVSRLVSTAFEGGYRYIPGILGDDGISKEFNESNLGGFTVGIKVLIGR